MVLTNEVEVGGVTGWRVETGPKGQERPYETTGSTRSVVAGWGHLQGETEVVAFAMGTVLPVGPEPTASRSTAPGRRRSTWPRRHRSPGTC